MVKQVERAHWREYQNGKMQIYAAWSSRVRARWAAFHQMQSGSNYHTHSSLVKRVTQRNYAEEIKRMTLAGVS